MSDQTDVGGLLPALAALRQLLARFGDNGVVIGGVAASLIGRPRMTADVDAVMLLSVEVLPQLIAAAQGLGLSLRHSDGAAFARKHRVLLLRHDESGTPVDISLGFLPFEIEAVNRAAKVTFGSVEILLPTPEDLIIMKAVAGRPKDLFDIEAIVQAHPDLDSARIQRWLDEFGRVLDSPDLWGQIRRMIGKKSDGGAAARPAAPHQPRSAQRRRR